MKTVAILGSTGSIGQQALKVIEDHPGEFQAIALSAGKNIVLLAEQTAKFNPQIVCVAEEKDVEEFKVLCKVEVDVVTGDAGLAEIAENIETDILLNALVGSIGLLPTLRALERGTTVALANKETMVAGGELIDRILEEKSGQIIPVDSEHSAIFQCLEGEERDELRRILLTASGGPFLDMPIEQMAEITVEKALRHPRWVMGPKITIDSSTMMNKGLEVIEAHYLFDADYDKIEVVIHPQSIIHSMVEFIDGSIKAHLGLTDMRIPIQYALSYPHRLDSTLTGLDFSELRELTFAKPDMVKFPCLCLAYSCGQAGGTYPAVLNTANEETVAAFLGGKISFPEISAINEAVVNAWTGSGVDSYDDIVDAQDWARNKARESIYGQRHRFG